MSMARLREKIGYRMRVGSICAKVALKENDCPMNKILAIIVKYKNYAS
jgi:hypothetical protein